MPCMRLATSWKNSRSRASRRFKALWSCSTTTMKVWSPTCSGLAASSNSALWVSSPLRRVSRHSPSTARPVRWTSRMVATAPQWAQAVLVPQPLGPWSWWMQPKISPGRWPMASTALPTTSRTRSLVASTCRLPSRIRTSPSMDSVRKQTTGLARQSSASRRSSSSELRSGGAKNVLSGPTCLEPTSNTMGTLRLIGPMGP